MRRKRPTATQVLEAYCPSCETSWPSALELCPTDGSRLVRLSQAVEEHIGTTVGGRFRVERLLGDGGMGSVYQAFDERLGHRVALKLVHRRLSNDLGAAKRFLREARLTSSLDHPNIVRVHHYGQTDDQVLYLAMEVIGGQSLEHHLDRRRVLQPGVAGRICLDTLCGLACAHRAGIVHRDVKPSNIMLARGSDGKPRVVVLDFGLARSLDTPSRTTPGYIVGTPAYLAPEAARNQPATPQSDQYAVGVVLFEAVTGKVPFDAEDPYAVLSAHLHQPLPPLPPDVPPALGRFITRLLEKDPGRRFASAAAAARALEEVLTALADPRGVADTERITRRQPPRLRRAAGKGRDRAPLAAAKTLTRIRPIVEPAVESAELAEDTDRHDVTVQEGYVEPADMTYRDGPCASDSDEDTGSTTLRLDYR